MTDVERSRLEAICKVAKVDDIEDLSDGFHTFRQLYYQRMMLFATIVKQNKDKAWKSLRHEDGELCFGGEWFIVGIDTQEGSYTYHYENNFYSLFDCEELERGKHWDGHTEKDVTRLLSLPSAQPYTEAEIQKMQELEQAELEKAFELGKAEANRWIPCSEKMAEFPCLACDKFGQIFVPVGVLEIEDECYDAMYFQGDVEQFLKGECVFRGVRVLPRKIIAWMPLPEPYDDFSEHMNKPEDAEC